MTSRALKSRWKLLPRRIWALVLRYIFLLTGSWPRLVELIYWPTLNMLVWGFVNIYIMRQGGGSDAAPFALLAGAMLWEVLVRSQISVQLLFLEELWSRNLGHIFVSPIAPLEYLGGLVFLSLLRTFIAMVPCALLAWAFFDFDILDLGELLAGFYLNLAATGWCCGFLMIALLLRFGLSSEWLAWMGVFLLLPFVAVYYPVNILPAWAQHIAWALPPTYVFESMRALLHHEAAPSGYVWKALGLNMVYLALSAAIYKRAFETTRRRGGLLQMAE